MWPVWKKNNSTHLDHFFLQHFPIPMKSLEGKPSGLNDLMAQFERVLRVLFSSKMFV
jgi:hypothetical protein